MPRRDQSDKGDSDDIRRLIEDVQTFVHDQIAAVKEDVDASLKIAAEAEAKASKGGDRSLERILASINALDQRLKVVESGTWKLGVFVRASVAFSVIVSGATGLLARAGILGDPRLVGKAQALYAQVLESWNEIVRKVMETDDFSEAVASVDEWANGLVKRFGELQR